MVETKEGQVARKFLIRPHDQWSTGLVSPMDQAPGPTAKGRAVSELSAEEIEAVFKAMRPQGGVGELLTLLSGTGTEPEATPFSTELVLAKLTNSSDESEAS